MKMKMMPLLAGAALTLSVILSTPASAGLKIVLGNDDGCESAATHAVYQKLTAAGHSVIIAASMADQSGEGGATRMFTGIKPLAVTSRSGNLPVGTSGIATLPTSVVSYGARVFCVNSTPVASILYGIDVAAIATFGGTPDLVISGPNYGNNTGAVNNTSGTVNAALIAINRGVPGIAVSSAATTFTKINDLTSSSIEQEFGTLVVSLVAKLEANKAKAGGALIPQGFGLNVNFPSFTAGSSGSLQWAFSKEGYAAMAMPFFVSRLGDHWIGPIKASPQDQNDPGITVRVIGFPDTLAEGKSFITDNNPTSEQNVISPAAPVGGTAPAGKIAVSVIQGNHQAGRAAEGVMRTKLNGLVQ